MPEALCVPRHGGLLPAPFDANHPTEIDDGALFGFFAVLHTKNLGAWHGFEGALLDLFQEGLHERSAWRQPVA